MKLSFLIFCLPALLCSTVLLASAEFPTTIGERNESTEPGLADLRFNHFYSPSGVEETCLIIQKIPGGHYYDANHEWDIRGDEVKERNFCAANFHGGNIGLCPKTWSTSPGTIVWDLSKSDYAGRAAEFEANECSGKKDIKVNVPGAKKLAKLKTTMNASGTSGTFSQSSLMYYHFSRYFHSSVYVPVSVYRSIDKDEHLERVATKGQAWTSRGMISAAWDVMVRALNNPRSYSPTDDLFTASRDKVYGIMIRGKGDRFSAAINGTRENGWGLGQNKDYMETAPFTALRTGGEELNEAVRVGIAEAFRNRTIAKETSKPFGPAVSGLQMVYWMKELSEIAILDFIFSQQDRVGNIDYRWYWYWTQDGQVRWAKAKTDSIRRRLKDIPIPTDVPQDALLIQRTQLNDNDAGGLVRYANFAKKARHLESIRHMSADTYSRLIALHKNFEEQGELYDYVIEHLRLTERQQRQIFVNTRLAVEKLQATCEAEKMHFDLNPEKTFLTGGAFERLAVDCATGEVGEVISTGTLNINDARDREIN